MSNRYTIEIIADAPPRLCLGDVIAECKQPITASNAKSIDERIAQIKQLLKG